MNTTKRHDLKTLSREMRLAAWYDGKHYWNTATAVAHLYEPESLRARFVRWALA